MKLDLDCIRAILLSIERYPQPMDLTFDDFCQRLPDFSQENILYCCIKLYEANYINLNYIHLPNTAKPVLDTIGDLTFFGHEFLENIKKDTTWNKTKSILFKIGSYSFDAIKQVSALVIAELIKQAVLNT